MATDEARVSQFLAEATIAGDEVRVSQALAEAAIGGDEVHVSQAVAEAAIGGKYVHLSQFLIEVVIPVPIPPEPPCDPIIPGRVRRLEVWDDTVANGGQRQAFIPEWSEVRFTRELDGREFVRVEMPRLSKAFPYITEQAVLRTVYEDLTWEEWRIVPSIEEERRQDNALVATIEAESMTSDLGNTVVERVQANGDVWHDFPLEQLSAREHAEFIISNAPSYWAVGDVEVSDDILVDMQYQWDTCLSALRELCAVLKSRGIAAELETQYCRGQYLVHIRSERGSWAKRARLRYGLGNRSIRKRRSASQQATRVYPRGQEIDGFSLTIEDAAWPVIAIASGESRITLSGEPIGFSGMLNDLYVERVGATLRQQILDSIPPGDLMLASVSGLELGRSVHVRRDGDGTKLSYLEHPAAKEAYGLRSRVIQHQDIPWIDNLAPNPFLTEWPAASGVPPVGYAVFGSPAINQETDGLYWRYGGASAHLICASGEGIEQEYFEVEPTEISPYFSAMASLYMRSGRLRVSLIADTVGDGSATMQFPASGEESVTKVQNTWLDQFGVQGLDLYEAGARRVKLRLEALQGGTEFWLDAVQVTQTAEAPETFHAGRGSNDLWRAGLADLERYAFPEVEYDVDVLDVHRLDPETFAYDYLVLGQTVQIHDPDLEINVARRIVRLEQDGDNEGVARVELENPGRRLSRELATPPRRIKRPPIRRKPVPEDEETGSGTPGGRLGQVTVTVLPPPGSVPANEINYPHNQAIEDMSPGEYSVSVYRVFEGVTTLLDSGLDPRIDTILPIFGGLPVSLFALRGTYRDEAFPVPSDHPGAVETTYGYIVELYRGGTLLERKEASRTGHYLLGAGLFHLTVEAIDLATNRLNWGNTRVVEDAGAGVYTVTIRRSISGQVPTTIVTGRDPRLDAAGAMGAELAGGYDDSHPAFPGTPQTYEYEVDLLENDVVIATYVLPPITVP